MTFLSPRATAFHGRNALDTGFEPALNLRRSAGAILDALGRLMAMRDRETANHALRVQQLAVAVAQEACGRDEFLIAAVEAAAPLHDIGKLAIPDCVLHKPGPLSDGEYEVVKRHAAVGAEILEGLEFGAPLALIVRHHHENWDGSGYPDRLRGEAIPMGARILAVVDCYDALTSARPYREPVSHRDAIELIVTRRGTMYDPAVLDVFARVAERVRPAGALATYDCSSVQVYQQPLVRVI